MGRPTYAVESNKSEALADYSSYITAYLQQDNQCFFMGLENAKMSLPLQTHPPPVRAPVTPEDIWRASERACPATHWKDIYDQHRQSDSQRNAGSSDDHQASVWCKLSTRPNQKRQKSTSSNDPFLLATHLCRLISGTIKKLLWTSIFWGRGFGFFIFFPFEYTSVNFFKLHYNLIVLFLLSIYLSNFDFEDLTIKES